MAMDQEQLIRLLAETQARLDKIEEENNRLKGGVDTINKRLEEEVALRIASEKKAQEFESKRETQEQERSQKLLDIQKQQEADRQKQKASHAANLNVLDSTGVSLLHHACWAFDYPTINRLIREGADVNVKSSTGHTCLDIARNRGGIPKRVELVLLLRAHGGRGDKSGTLVYENPVEQYPGFFTYFKHQDQINTRKDFQEKHAKVAHLLKM